MSSTWYYGDVLTTGNTVMQQGLAVLGTTWTPNVLCTQVLGAPSGPFGTLVVSNANVTTAMNVLSFGAGLAINVASARGATLNVLGNVTVSNAFSTGGILTSLVNTGTLNVLSVTSPLALNVASASGTSLYVRGNVYVSNGLGVGNLVANMYTALANVVTGTVTSPSAPFVVAGWALVTNAIVTSNLVFGPGSMNVSQANLLSVPGPLGLGGLPGPATLNVTGNFLASNTLGGSNVLSSLMNVNVSFGTQNLVSLQGGPGPATLNVAGNVQVSNLFQVQNIFTNSLNSVTLNVTSLVAGQVGGPGGTLNVSGNVQVSNSLQVPNVYTVLNVNQVANVSVLSGLLNAGLGTSNGLPNVWVSGNVQVSNSVSVPVIYASAANVVRANVQTLVTGAWTLAGNVQVSNTVTTQNVQVTGGSANAQTLNVGGLSVLSLGLGATPGANITVTGNVSFGSSVVTGGLVAQGQLTYTDDLARRSPHLVPSVSNAAQIQAWIRASSNLTRASGAFSTQVASAPVSGGYWGSVLCPSGQVVLVPATANNVGVWNPLTGLLTLGPDQVTGFRGGVLDPTGNVILVPWTSTAVGVFCPATLQTTLVPTGLSFPGFDGGSLVPSGNVIFFPYATASSPGQYNPVTQTFSVQGPGFGAGQIHGGTLTPTGQIITSPGVSGTVFGLDSITGATTTWGPVRGVGQDSFLGAVLDPLGNVVFVPYMSGNVVTFSPGTGTWSNVQATADGLGSWSGGTLGPTGNVIFFPNGASNIGLFDPVALTFSNGAPGSGSGYVGGSLLVNGTLVMCPGANASGVGISSFLGARSTQEFCTSPYVNKGP